MTNRVGLPMAGSGRKGKDGLVPCTSCGRCCTYVAVAINAPTTARRATEVLWHLYHAGVSVHRDADGEWSTVFEARCRHLRENLHCAVYEQRPHICRAFDHARCEVNAPHGGTAFSTPAEFLDWLKARRPRVHARLARNHLPRD